MTFTPYRHTVQYYETDKMGITHHANYIHIMEEARIDFLRQMGWDYAKLESLGIISPVTGIACNYKHSTTFSDEVYVIVSVTEFKGVRLKLRYEMTNAAGEIVCLADSEHCFLNRQGHPIRLRKEFPEFYHALMECCPAEEPAADAAEK